MKRFLALLICLVCLCSVAHAEQTDWKTWLEEDVTQPISELFANETLITAVGMAQAEKTNDIAVLTFSLSTRGETVAVAYELLNEAVDSLCAALTARGIAETEIYQSGYDVSPDIAYHNTKLTDPQIIAGYVAEMDLMVRLHDPAMVTAVLDAAFQSGAENSHDLKYESSTAAEAYQAALAQAVQQAMEKAQTMAEACGLTLGDLISVAETSSGLDECAMVEVTYRAK